MLACFVSGKTVGRITAHVVAVFLLHLPFSLPWLLYYSQGVFEHIPTMKQLLSSFIPQETFITACKFQLRNGVFQTQ